MYHFTIGQKLEPSFCYTCPTNGTRGYRYGSPKPLVCFKRIGTAKWFFKAAK